MHWHANLTSDRLEGPSLLGDLFVATSGGYLKGGNTVAHVVTCTVYDDTEAVGECVWWSGPSFLPGGLAWGCNRWTLCTPLYDGLGSLKLMACG